MNAELQQKWRDNWLKIEERPLDLADLTCGTCGYVPDWLEIAPGTNYPWHAQRVKREVQQSQLLFHLASYHHSM